MTLKGYITAPQYDTLKQASMTPQVHDGLCTWKKRPSSAGKKKKKKKKLLLFFLFFPLFLQDEFPAESRLDRSAVRLIAGEEASWYAG